MVHSTSAALNGLPSCHVTPWRRVKVSVLPSSLKAHFSARSGTMSSRLFCFLLGSNITRLLNTPIIGSTTEIVPSSWIDMLAGLSRWVMRRMPPCFWAQAEPNGRAKANTLTIPTIRPTTRFIRPSHQTFGSRARLDFKLCMTDGPTAIARSGL